MYWLLYRNNPNVSLSSVYSLQSERQKQVHLAPPDINHPYPSTLVVDGYKIREAIQRWILKRDTAAKLFNDSIFSFDDETKLHPKAIHDLYATAEEAIADLEDLQDKFNSQIFVAPLGRRMSLGRAVKRLGGAGRREKMWRTAATDSGKNRWQERELSRRTDEVRATKRISYEDAMKYAEEARKWASALRAAVAQGNALTIEVTDSQLIQFLES